MGNGSDEWVESGEMTTTVGEDLLKDDEVIEDEVDDIPEEDEEDKKKVMTVSVVPVGKDSSSKIFDEFRRLGFVSNRVPCLIRYIHTRRQNFIVTCNGKAFNTYVGQQLKLISIGGMTTDEISCMAADTYHVYTAVKNKIFAWRRGTELKHTYEDPFSVQISHLLPFGNHLISLDVTGELLLWNIRTSAVVRRIKFKVENFLPTCILHPLSFLNKVLIASSKGAIQLWNINRAALVHHFGRFEGRRINAIVQAPSVGVVAVAFADKKITLFNFEYDKIIMTLECLDEPITVSFRLDNLPIMMVGSSKGSITAWDLNNREVICFNQSAHQSSITGLVTFMGEPIFVSSSVDNSVKVWIFDKTDGGFRLLNSRDGHHKSPIQIRFQGERAMNLITTSTDGCLRSFHLYNETYNRTINNFVPNSEEVKGRGVSTWNFGIVGGSNHPIAEDIVAFSPFSSGLHTFSFGNARRGKDLIIPAQHKTPVSCVTLTACSQFAIVGFTNGIIHRYNMQSKILRKEYKPIFKDLHRGKPEVTGVAVDVISTIIASGGLDMLIRFWDFDKGTMLHSYQCNAQIEKIFSQRNSNLFGVVLNSFEIWIFDFSTFSLVRELKGCFNPITDACMSPDCRWVTAATADGWIKTWDMPTSGLVDVFQLQDTVTSLEYSPSGEFLATTLSQELGILLWVNKTMYEHVSLNPLPEDFDPADFLKGQEDKSALAPVMKDALNALHLKEDLENALPVLSTSVVHKWKDLLQLEAIKERNKPKTPVSQPDAPFFIGSSTGIDATRPSLADEIQKQNEEIQPQPSKSKAPVKSPDLVLSEKLSATGLKDAEYYDDVMSFLEALGPSGLDLAIRSMRPEMAGPSSVTLMIKFLELVLYQIKRVDKFESIHSFLALFLQVHHDSLMTEVEFILLLEQLQEVVSKLDNHVSRQMNNIICLTDFCRLKLFS